MIHKLIVSTALFTALLCVLPLEVVGQSASPVDPPIGTVLSDEEFEKLAAQQNAEMKNRIKRFQLFNNCEPMYSGVEDLDEDAARINLTEKSLELALESSLRSARLYGFTLRSFLYLNVSVMARGVHSISLEYLKRVYDPMSDKMGRATTWDTGSIGTHGSGSGSFGPVSPKWWMNSW